MENAESKATPAPDTSRPPLPIRDRVQLAQGFYFLFFGGMLSVVLVGQLAVDLAPPALLGPLSAGSLLMMWVGAVRLRRIKELGSEWRRATGCLLVATGLLVYLFPFVWAWRQVPRSLYFSCHAFAFLLMMMLTMMAMSVVSATLARAMGRSGLTWQMVLSLVSAVVVQLAPFSYLLLVLFYRTPGEDAVMWVQSFVAGLHPFWITVWLLPFTLSLSLVWTAKDIALEPLLETPPTATENSG